MKKIFFAWTLLLMGSIAIAQQDSTNLKKSGDSYRDELLIYKDKEINNYKKAISKHKQDSINFKANETRNLKEINTLKTTNEQLISKITSLEKNKLAKKNEDLEIEIQKLTKDTASLHVVIKQKDITILKEKDKCLESQTKLKAELFDNLSKEVTSFYINNSLDYLLAHCTQQSIENDKKYLKQSPEINNKLAATTEYIKAKQLLCKQFDEVRVTNQVEILKKIQFDSDSIRKTIEILENYNFQNQNLRDLIITIKDIDTQKGNSDGDFLLNKLKFQIISAQFATFLIDNNFLIAYPYLKNTMTEIMKLKNDNADTPIDKYLNRL